MKVVFITRLFYPHVGGVEKQLEGLCEVLINRGHKITMITERYSKSLKQEEIVDGIKIVRIDFPKIPLFGLIVIWFKLLKKYKLFYESDLVHCFGSFMWILPLRILFFLKSFCTTFFGWEGTYPVPVRYKILRYLACHLSNKTIADAGFIEKHYGIKVNKMRYASAAAPKKEVNLNSKKKEILYVGRLDSDTGLYNILEGLSLLKKTNIDFCGDGPLLEDCKKYGKVHGFVDPTRFYRDAKICLSPGHTSIIESFFNKCLIVTSYNNKLKRDYLLMTPFKDWIVVEKDPKMLAKKIDYYLNHPEKAMPMIEAAHQWVQGQTWKKMADTYEELWGVKKAIRQ